MRHMLPIVSCLVMTTPVLAQGVDADGAMRLSQDLSRYLGTTAIDKRVVVVGVEGDAYRIAFDFKALTALFPPQAGLKVDIAPFSVLAKPRTDQTWDITTDAFPGGSFQFDGPQGMQSAQWSIADGKFSGVYDPALAAFLTLSGSQSGMTMASKEARQEMNATIGAGTFASAGTPSPGGGADLTFSQAMTDFMETVKVIEPGGDVPVPVTFKARNLTFEGRAKGYRTRSLLDLLAFGVANSNEAALKASQAELKSRLSAILPIWNRMEGSYRLNDVTAETPFGAFGANTLRVAFGMDGAVRNAAIHYDFGAAGLSLPDQLVPAWSSPLMPTEFDLKFAAVGFDLDGMARTLINALDLNRQPPVPVEITNQIEADFLAEPPKIVMSRSTVKSREMEVAAEAEVTFMAGKPNIDATVEVSGYDKLVDGLQVAAKEEPAFADYVTFALAAKGFGKALPDGRIQWVVNIKADGSVDVNGVKLKGPDPQ